MQKIIRKIESLKKLRCLSKPTKMGDKILLLATAPCVEDFFKYESVREQFKGYDLAFINYMLVYSEKEVFEYKPKYIILLDPIFYQSDYFGVGTINSEKEKVVAVLEKIDWECYLLTSVLADFGLKNTNIKYIKLSCFEFPYRKWLIPVYKRNLLNMGVYNVMQGALYFAVTFGYKKIAILGCTYGMNKISKREDGVHLEGYAHYYDKEPIHEFVPLEQVEKMKYGLVSSIYDRGRKSMICFWNINKFALLEGAEIINYSEGSFIDAFKAGKLNK